MNIENNKGITLVALIITIVMILILAGVTIDMGTDMIKTSRLQNVTTELLMIEAKVKEVAEQNRFDSTNNQLVGTKMTDMTDSSVINEANIAGATNFDEWYYISRSDLDTFGLQALEGEYYLVKYKDSSTGNINIDVIYPRGYKHTDGNTYYKLSVLKELL